MLREPIQASNNTSSWLYKCASSNVFLSHSHYFPSFPQRGVDFSPFLVAFFSSLSPSDADVAVGGAPPLSFTPQCWQMGQTVGLWYQWVGTAAEIREINGRKEEGQPFNGAPWQKQHWDTVLKLEISFFFKKKLNFYVSGPHGPHCRRNWEALGVPDPSQTYVICIFLFFFLKQRNQFGFI